VSLPFKDFEAHHLTLTPSTDEVVTFGRTVEAVRVRNWDTANRILVKTAAIGDDNDADSDRVGMAATSDIPNVSVFPVRRDSIVVRSAGASEVTVTGYF